MRFAVESWAPDYGTPLSETELEPSTADVDADIETPSVGWAPRRPTEAEPASTIRFVDGVRRIDARVWITGDDGITRAGVAASYAAGVVSCDGAARIEACEVRRSVLSAAPGLEAISTRHSAYVPCEVESEGTDAAILKLQERMGALEALVAARAEPAELLVSDGPLRKLLASPGAVGYVKTHQRSYLPPELSRVVTALRTGERTPLFLLATPWRRYSWYLRLPGGEGHPWAGVIRGEAPGDLPLHEAARCADVATVTLPRFASSAHKDPRAPQNLHPIAELERTLRRHLGNGALMERSLRLAARGGQ